MPDTTIPVTVVLHIPVNPLDAKTPEEAQEFVKDILKAARGKLLIPIYGDGDGVKVSFTQTSEFLVPPSPKTQTKHFESVKNTLIDHLCIQESDIQMETPLAALGADSLDVVEIKLDLEREYDTEFPEGIDLVLVGDFVRQLDNLFGEQ